MAEFSQAVLLSGDPEIAPFLNRFCQHTGKPCGKTSTQELQTLLQVHGREITITILQMRQKDYAPEWIWQNPEGLANLCLWEPKEYFIFVLSTLMFPASKATGDANFQRKIQAWQNIKGFDIEFIKPIAELCRRILGRCSPRILSKVLAKCHYTGLVEITQTEEALSQFHIELIDLLKWLVANQKKLEAEDKRGFTRFAAQRMIMGLTALERDVMREFNDFELIQDKSPLAVEILTNKSYATVKRPKAKQPDKYKTKPFVFKQSKNESGETKQIKLSFAKKGNDL